MEFDNTYSITAIIAVCSIFSPIITTLINLIFQAFQQNVEMKNKQYTLNVIHKREIIENCIKCAGKCACYTDIESIKEFGESCLLAAGYLNGEAYEKAMYLFKEVNRYEGSQDTVIKSIESFLPLLKKEIQKLPKYK